MKLLLAELAGTFGLVFCGTTAVVLNEVTGGALGIVGIALVFGGIVFAMIKVFAPVSGAHLNPAVTLGLASAGRSRWSSVPGFIAAQLAGALLASLCVKCLFPANQHLGATIPSGAPWISFMLEIALTFILMLVILWSSRIDVVHPAIAIGGTVGLEALLAGPISGASMNPARSLGPAVVSGNLSFVPLYVVAPLLGALLAVPASRLLPPGTDQSKVVGRT